MNNIIVIAIVAGLVMFFILDCFEKLAEKWAIKVAQVVFSLMICLTMIIKMNQTTQITKAQIGLALAIIYTLYAASKFAYDYGRRKAFNLVNNLSVYKDKE